MLLNVGFEMDWEDRWEGEMERPGREVVEGESSDEPRREELPLASLPRDRLLGNNFDSNPDIIAAIPFRPCDRRLLAASLEIEDDASDFTSSSVPKTCPVDARRAFSSPICSDDLHGSSSTSDFDLSGELGADAMADELIRNGEEANGSTGLRRPSLEDQGALPVPVPALLADCGVFSRPFTARLKLFLL